MLYIFPFYERFTLWAQTMLMLRLENLRLSTARSNETVKGRKSGTQSFSMPGRS